MELSRAQIGLALLAAIAIGAGWAWWNRPVPAPTPTSRQGQEISPAAAGERHIYKWQDDSGVWNFTDRPPADRPYTEVSETPNVTVLPTVVPDTADADPKPAPSPDDKRQKTEDRDQGTEY